MPKLDWQAVFPLLCSFLLAASAIYALRGHTYRTRIAIGTAAYAGLAAVSALFLGMRALDYISFLSKDLVNLAPAVGVAALALVFLILTRMLFGAPGSILPWLLGGVILLAAALWIGVALPPTVGIQRLSLSAGSLAALWIGATSAAIILTSQSLHQFSRYYTVASYWVVVMACGIIGDGLLLVSLHLPGLVLPGLGLRTLAILLSTYAAPAPRLPEIGRALRHFLNRLLFAAILTVILATAFYIGPIILKQFSIANSLLKSLILGLALAILLDPLLTRLRKRLKHWIIGEQIDSTGQLRHYSQSITNILDLNLLAAQLVNTISEIMGVRRGFVFLVDNEKDPNGDNQLYIRGVKGMGNTNPIPCRLPDSSPLVLFFRYEYKPLTLNEVHIHRRFQELPKAELLWLDQLAVEVLTPIYAKNEWIGLLALGPKSNGRPFTPKELNLLSSIADQTAVALENIRLVEGLVRLNNDFRRAYTALNQANRNLERLDKSKSDFISIASHELRTPMTVISGASQMLMEDSGLMQNQYHKELLTKLHAGTQRLHEIVDSMLDIAKIDSRAFELDPQPVVVSGLILKVVQELSEYLAEREQVLNLDGLEDLPDLHGDRPALFKAFHHLIINAIKYTPDHGKITITGHLLPAGDARLSDETALRNGGVEIIVQDTGIGIDPRFQELIFTKFYQTGELALHSSGKSKFKGGGPGLGLAIVKGIIEAHQGKVWVESPGYNEAECPGSAFHVVLPLRANPGN